MWSAAGPARFATSLRETVGLEATVGVERVNAGAAIALANLGLNLVDPQEAVERARAIKTPDEVACQIESMRATERAMAAMEAEIRPGRSENELWSVFHQHVIAQGGDYIETRLLSPGEHTNPWFQESAKVIGENELIAFDTDVVGCHGYYADYSRTFMLVPTIRRPNSVSSTGSPTNRFITTCRSSNRV